MNAPDMRQAFIKHGLEPQTNTPGEFAAYIQGELAQNSKLIKFVGVNAE